VLVAGCGVDRAPDNSRVFVSCLQHAGGRVITQGSQLQGLPSTDVQLAAAVAFDSVSYASIDVESRTHARRQALVFVEDPRAPSGVSDASPSELLRRARADRADVRTVVLLPPAADTEAQVGACEQAAAPNQTYP
jgi:hypothetical protein